MTDFTTIQTALRSRAEYLKGVDTDIARADGDVMYQAALYIDSLERDQSARHAVDFANVLSERDSFRAERDKLADAHAVERRIGKVIAAERDEAYKKLAVVTSERDSAMHYYITSDAALVKACKERDAAIEQRNAYSRGLDNEVQMRNDLRAELARVRGFTPQPVHGPVFEQVKSQILADVKSLLHSCGVFAPSDIPATSRYFVTGMGPSWFVRDRSQPLPNKFNIERCESVGKFGNLDMAKRFAACLNTLVPNTKL